MYSMQSDFEIVILIQSALHCSMCVILKYTFVIGTIMSRLLVCCPSDLPSKNMRDALLNRCDWEDLGSDGRNSFERCGDNIIMTISDKHLEHDYPERDAEAFGIHVDDVVFMSRHSAKSGTPALTVHPIGNYHENLYGGDAEHLVKASPSLMSDALRNIMRFNDTEGTQTCFEVTHHGPLSDKPTFFIEIGSDESHWGNTHAAEIQADVIMSMQPAEDHLIAIGVGGGHYAPRFTEACCSYKVDFGHLIPNYQLEGRDDEDIVRMMTQASDASGTKLVYLHRKSMKKPEERRISSLIASSGLEQVSSKDFEQL